MQKPSDTNTNMGFLIPRKNVSKTYVFAFTDFSKYVSLITIGKI